MKKDSPGVKFPSPLYYILAFIASIYLQKYIPIDISIFQNPVVKIAGIILLLISLVYLIPSIVQFARSKNTLVTILPATSLQTTGIYRFTRNPMYLGLVIAYAGIVCLFGNWWGIALLVLLIILQNWIIKREERYLEREFGQQYIDYKNKVRRWV
jgi:protein-S-isoprenylcysteine O-methyltransferase Ste14